IRGQSCLIAESSRPGGHCRNRTSLIGYGRFHFDYVRVVEAESFSDDKVLVGVFEGDVSRRCLGTFARGDVERRTQAAAEALVISPERERVTVLRRCGGIDQIERAVLSVVV